MKEFLLFFFIQLASYFIVTCNFRAISQGRYTWTVLTDMTISAFQFWLIRQIAESGTIIAWLGMVCGGGIGSMLGIWVTKRFWHE